MSLISYNEDVIDYPTWKVAKSGEEVRWYFMLLAYNGKWVLSSLSKDDHVIINDNTPFLYRKPNSLKAWSVVLLVKFVHILAKIF